MSRHLHRITISIQWIAGLSLWQGVAVAAPGAESTPAAREAMRPGISTGDLLQLSIGLLLVLLGIFAVAWFLRRTGRFQGSGDGALRVLGGLALSTRERVVLVQVGRAQLLLGVAPGSVRTLHVLDEASQVEAAPAGGQRFAERMASALSRQGLAQ